MNAHTPGPWTAQHNGVYWQIDSKRDGQVGDVCASNTIFRDQELLSEKETAVIAEANARLFAAAPELLEALRDIVSDHAALSPATLAFARTVIAKATGGG